MKKKILICYSENTDPHKKYTELLIKELKNNFSDIEIIEKEVKDLSLCHKSFDFAFSVGGDGTFLRVAHSVINTPIIGINLGRKGFLATIEKSEISYAVEKIKNNQYSVKKRYFIEGTTDTSDGIAVNDITIGKENFMKTIHIALYVDNKLVNTYICDGMVISTAFGSTAYNKALTNMVAHPDAPIYIITPIASNDNLFSSLIINCESNIRVNVLPNDASSKIVVGFDGTQKVISMDKYLEVFKSENYFQAIEFDDFDYYENLRKKS